MATNHVEWNLRVSPAVDASLREFLADEGTGAGEAVDRFVEEAVRERIFEMTAKAINQQNAGRSAEEIERIADEAVRWA
jgi:phosphate uptake regulator